MALFKRRQVWWYKFYFAGQEIRESSKSNSKTVAKNAEQQRRKELEAGNHNLKEVRQQRIRYLSDVIADYLVGYRLRYRSASLGLEGAVYCFAASTATDTLPCCKFD